MVEPTVTLVIPCYNAGSYVGEAIDSALSQTRPPDEIIVVDDGSEDDSSRVVRGFGDKVRYAWQENRGISGARNTGIAMASGSVVALLDADDLWPPDSLTVRLELMAGNPDVDLVYGRVVEFQGDQRQYRQISRPGRMAGAILVRRPVFERIGLFDASLRIGEMIDWVARADAAGCLSAVTDSVVLLRRLHGANTVIQGKTGHSEYLQVLRAVIERRRSVVGSSG